MFNHLSFGVRDLAGASRFYDAVLGALGYRRNRSSDAEVAYGPGSDMLFWLYPVEAHPVAAPRMHLAFDAPSREAVRAFVEAAAAQGGRIIRPAGQRPDISAEYFGAIVDDPDGHRLEVVVAGETMH